MVKNGSTKAGAALDLLNSEWIGDRKWIGGDQLSIGDFWLAGLLSIGDLLGVDYGQWPNVGRWYDSPIRKIISL